MPFIKAEDAKDKKGKLKAGVKEIQDKNGRTRYIGPKSTKPPVKEVEPKIKKEKVKKEKVKKEKLKSSKVIDDIQSNSVTDENENENKNENENLTVEF